MLAAAAKLTGPKLLQIESLVLNSIVVTEQIILKKTLQCVHSFESPPSPIPLEHYHQQIIHQTMLYNFRNCRICTMGHFESKRRKNHWLFLALHLHSNYSHMHLQKSFKNLSSLKVAKQWVDSSKCQNNAENLTLLNKFDIQNNPPNN